MYEASGRLQQNGCVASSMTSFLGGKLPYILFKSNGKKFQIHKIEAETEHTKEYQLKLLLLHMSVEHIDEIRSFHLHHKQSHLYRFFLSKHQKKLDLIDVFEKASLNVNFYLHLTFLRKHRQINFSHLFFNVVKNIH